MSRPNRLYTIDGKYYYIKDGKKVFVKVPAGVSQKQVSKINIKNIIKLAESKRVVRKKKRRNLAYQKKIAPVLQKSETSGLPIYFFKPSKKIPTLEEQAEASADTTVEKLAKLLLKDSTLVPSSSKLPAEPTIATPSVGSRLKNFFTPKKKSMKPNVAGLATTITESKMETGQTPSKEQVRSQYPPGAQIPTPTIVKATAEARNRPGFLRSMFSPSPARNLGTSLSTVSEEEKQDETPTGKKTPPSIGLQRTTGKGHGSDGLYDDEIETIAKKRLKDFVPVIAKDETNELMKYVKRGDKQFSFVINTDDSMDRGRHWRCVYINNRDDYPSIEYFDPLTEGKPEQSLIDACRKIAIKMNPSKLFKFKMNMIRRQSKLTSNCGYHVIQFLEGRYQGIPFSEVTGYDQFIENMKKQHGELDGSGHGEKELKPLMKAYDSYI
jgi:hypothetical protein